MPQTIASLIKDATRADGSARSIRAAARLMSILESEPERLPELFREIPIDQWPNPRLILGITGAPGAGKSTLTDQLVAAYRLRRPDSRLGVIAVDPSSPFTGGAVLGDRVRMMRHSTDPQIFIRSLSSRGHLGGLSLGVKGVLRVMGLIGCDTVFIETVGVGQSEIEVTRVADLVLVILAPGQGDSIQMLKAGLMEIGDLFVVNKADREGASHLHATLLSALGMDHDLWKDELAAHGDSHAMPVDDELADSILSRRRPEKPEVFLVSATEQTGIDELIFGLEKRVERSEARWKARRDEAVLEEVKEAVFEDVRKRIEAALGSNGDAALELKRILIGELTVPQLSDELIKKVSSTGEDAGR